MEEGSKSSLDSVLEINDQEVGFSGNVKELCKLVLKDDPDSEKITKHEFPQLKNTRRIKKKKKTNKLKKKNRDYLLKKKIFLPYGVEPVIDCEIDEDSDEPDYSRYVLKKPLKPDYLLEKKIFLPYGVGPDIDCEIDDDNDEPDYLSYATVPKVDLVEDSSTPTNTVP